ncbi:GGDEF domain-containing protein [Pseudobutyrivibrio xylanivorans]|uniref:GGDEF domain-containing protein n=1 Tax=Pseudobutyrivibrio xylanivorans TaxID=185007 RepID=A0A5P6VVJ7_PSEXY|nr:GGDEF domain-containing protein [Pseudobutyrivibrio xylanivorans]QFJ55121.1 GGDEF domain-containing protein [Pseudobutyrivibrio xylanivorans]
MIEVPGWIVLSFFTSILLILLLIFQNKTSRLQKGKKYSAILVCTLVLLISEAVGRVGETYPDKYLILAKVGYFIIFLLDPADILFAVSYVDCWMDSGNVRTRAAFRQAFRIFALLNIVLVTISSVFDLRWFFYFENGVYYRGPFFLIRALSMMLFITLLVVYSIVFRKDFMSEYKNVILCLPVFAFLGAVFQVFLANLELTYAGISLGCLVLFFCLQSRDVNIDYLTGVLNRRAIDIKIEEKVRICQTSGKEFVAVMLDVDNFKTINDNFGHDEGDKAIKIIAGILQDTFGRNAFIGRFGGDEFCVVVDNEGIDKLEERLDNVREKLQNQRKRHGWDRSVDVSFGYAIYNSNKYKSAKEFAESIDKQMYKEKQIHHSQTV